MSFKMMYEATFRFIQNEMKYPSMKDVLSGRALFGDDTGKEFYTALAKTKLADCDVANSYGVVLLRKQGVAARLVTGLYIHDNGEEFHLSKPDGRYLSAKGDQPGTLKVYDMENETFLTVPIPKEVQGYDSLQAIYETAEGFVVHLRQQGHFVLDVNRAEENKDIVIDQIGKILFSGKPSWPDQLFFLKHPPYVLFLKEKDLPPKDLPPIVGRSDVSAQTPDGKLHLVFNSLDFHTNEWRIYEITLNPTPDQKEITLKPSDLGQPIATVKTITGGITSKFSPDGSHLATTVPPDPNSKEATVIVFQDRKEIYRYSFEPIPDIAMSLYKDNPPVSQPIFRINNDGSLDIKQVNSNEALVTHVSPSVEKNEFRNVQWNVVRKKDNAGRILSWKLTYQSPEETKTVLEFINPGVSAPDMLMDVSLNGSWVLTNNNVFIGKDSSASQNNDTLHTCLREDDRVRCYHRGDKNLFDPIHSFVFKNPVETDKEDNSWPIEMSSPLSSSGQFSLWDVRMEQTVARGIRRFADLGIVNTSQDPAAYVLKKMLQDDPAHISTEGLRILLANLAERPDAVVHSQWLLLGAAKLFDAEADCEGIEENPWCVKERQDSEEFLKRFGATLDERLKKDLKTTAYFPNAEVVAKAWAFLFPRDPAAAQEFLKTILQASPERTAEALLLGIEHGFIRAENIPDLSFSENLLLETALGKALERRYQVALAQSRSQSTPLFSRIILGHYQILQEAITKRFGPSATPFPMEEGH